MSDSQTQVLQKMQDLYKLASEGVSKQDFLTSFSNVVSLVTRINKEMIKRQDDSFAAITAQFKTLEKDLKESVANDFVGLKTDLTARINKALADQSNGMKFIYDKVAALNDGLDGEDGHTPTNEELVALIKPLIPEAIKADEVDIDAIVAQVLAQVPKAGGTHIFGGGKGFQLQVGSTKKGLAQYLNLVAGTNQTVAHSIQNGVHTITLSSGAGAGVTVVNEEVPTDSGDHTNFTLAHTPTAGSVKLYRGGTRQQAGNGKDYTLSGTTITLANILIVSPVSEVLVVDYTY